MYHWPSATVLLPVILTIARWGNIGAVVGVDGCWSFTVRSFLGLPRPSFFFGGVSCTGKSAFFTSFGLIQSNNELIAYIIIMYIYLKD